MRVQNLGPVFTQASASGVHEVLVFSPDHDASWADLDDKHAGLAMAAIRDRMEDHARRSTVRYTQAIVNAGRAAGASLDHRSEEHTSELQSLMRSTYAVF